MTEALPGRYEHVTCELLITSRCNMACSYCIAKNLPSGTMSIEVGRKAIDMFVHLAEGGKSIEFTFSGGEPLSEFALFKELVVYARERTHERDMVPQFVVKTNGTILNEEILQFVKSYQIKSVISIDGINKVHDKHRTDLASKGTHAKIIDNLITLLRHDVLCVASVTVHPSSSSNLIDSIKYLASLGINQIDVGPAYGTVNWTSLESQQLSFSLMEIASYMRVVNRENIALEVGPLFRESEHVGRVLSNSWGCHAASKNLAFLPNGQITGCSALGMIVGQFPKLILGDVFNGLDQKAIDHLTHLAQADADMRTSCRNCQVSSNCTGGCLAINFSTHGVPLTPPELYCQTISTIPEAWNVAWAGLP